MPYYIKNWPEFQHYKNRRPTWFKLYFSILNEPFWISLGPEYRLLAITCMLLASHDHGYIPDDLSYILRVARLDEKLSILPLVEYNFLVYHDKRKKSLLASCYHPASKMLDREEKNKNKRREEKSVAQKVAQEPQNPNGTAWFKSNDGIEIKAREMGMWPARPGESYYELSQRILQRIKTTS